MNYQQTIDYLYAQLPMFSRIGEKAYKKDLHNTIELCKFLGDPQNKFRSVHVAGTNGKGSTTHMLAAVLQEAGYKTGLYTSPHIYDFGERIRVNGQMVSQQFVIDFVERTKEITAEIQPSFFELTVAMAYEYFANEKVDIAIIETGLGGKLDSTNIISPVLSVITNIGLDHTNILGNTLPEIALQKAGIIKKDTPVVIGEDNVETRPVFISTANEMNAPIYFASEMYITDYIDYSGGLLMCNHKNIETGVVEKLRLDLTGLYQVGNSKTVLAVIDQLKRMGFSILENHVHSGLENTRSITGLKGRWDIVSQNPTVIYDVAHNRDGIEQILSQLEIYYPESHYHFVLGFVKDKDVDTVLKLFPGNSSFYLTNAQIPRALPHTDLKQKALEAGLKGESFDNVKLALETAKTNSNEKDVIVVCGSFFIIAEAP